MKCFYHKSDLDGHCSGAVVKLKFPECEMIGVDYSDDLDGLFSRFGVGFDFGEDVYIVDFSFSMEDMDWMNKIVKLHWIDHHKTAIEDAHKNGFIASGGQLIEIGRGACELTWEYLHDHIAPLSIRMLSKYDVWNHEDQRVMPFQWGMREQPDTLPDNIDFWEAVFYDDEFFQYTVEKGAVLIRFQENQDAKYAKGMAYESVFEGLRAIVMNKPYANSNAFKSVYDPDKHDIMILFGVKPGQIKYGLYCDKPEIDVSAIAKKYGGGGHRGAAGFFSDKIII